MARSRRRSAAARSSSRSRSRSASRSCCSRSGPRSSRTGCRSSRPGTFVVVEGVIRGRVFIGYILLISLLPDLRRVFQYHGAEHKTINALEAGAELTPASVQKFSLIHPRCGTAFLLWVMIIAIFVFAFVGRPVVVLADREPHPAAAGDRGARVRGHPVRGPAPGQPRAHGAPRSGALAPAAHDPGAVGRPGRGLDPCARARARARGGRVRGRAAARHTRRSDGLVARPMPRIVREADIVWEGTTARGDGVVTAASSGAFRFRRRSRRGSATRRERRAPRSFSLQPTRSAT